MSGAVLVTRPHAAPLDRMLAAAGWPTVHLPLLELAPTGAPPPSARPGQVLITSAATVRHAPHLGAAVSGARVVAVGRSTAAALAGVGVQVAGVGDAGGAQAVDLLDPRLHTWYVGTDRPSAPLRAALASWPGTLSPWAVYRRRDLVPSSGTLSALPPLAAVTLTSASAARTWLSAPDRPPAPLVVIGPDTGATVLGCGAQVGAVAAEPNLAALVEAVTALLSSRAGG